MKIKAITPITKDDTFINELLSRGLFNDSMFEQTMIDVELEEPNRPEDMLYRRYYEQIYLCRQLDDSSISTDTHIKLSVSEAISFITMALPPVLQPNLKNCIKSLSAICETLTDLLIHDSGFIQLYHSQFIGLIKYEKFDIKTNMDMSFIDKHKSKLSNQVIAYVEAQHVEQSNLMYQRQCVLYAMTKQSRKELIDFILNDKMSYTTILGIKETDFDLYVEVWVRCFDKHNIPTIDKFIENTYYNI